jgi:hypothetical protein
VADLDDQDYEAIGRVVVACAEVEVIALPVLAAMMNMHEEMAQIAFSDRGHAWVLDALEDAVNLEVTDVALQQDWLKWVRDAKGVNRRRNTIIHARWLTPWKVGDDTMVSPRLMSEGRRSRRRKGLTMEYSSHIAAELIRPASRRSPARASRGRQVLRPATVATGRQPRVRCATMALSAATSARHAAQRLPPDP